jgi:hypothetical protein
VHTLKIVKGFLSFEKNRKGIGKQKKNRKQIENEQEGIDEENGGLL